MLGYFSSGYIMIDKVTSVYASLDSCKYILGHFTSV